MFGFFKSDERSAAAYAVIQERGLYKNVESLFRDYFEDRGNTQIHEDNVLEYLDGRVNRGNRGSAQSLAYDKMVRAYNILSLLKTAVDTGANENNPVDDRRFNRLFDLMVDCMVTRNSLKGTQNVAMAFIQPSKFRQVIRQIIDLLFVECVPDDAAKLTLERRKSELEAEIESEQAACERVHTLRVTELAIEHNRQLEALKKTFNVGGKNSTGRGSASSFITPEEQARLDWECEQESRSYGMPKKRREEVQDQPTPLSPYKKKLNDINTDFTQKKSALLCEHRAQLSQQLGTKRLTYGNIVEILQGYSQKSIGKKSYYKTSSGNSVGYMHANPNFAQIQKLSLTR